jgi:phosphate transport system protein
MRSLEDELLSLGETVESALEDAVAASFDGDVASARAVRDADAAVNERFAHIERRAVSLMATQQPTARDLREVLAILSVATDLERVGDHAKGIAGLCCAMGTPLPRRAQADLQRLLDLVMKMLSRSLQAFRDRDTALARSLDERDAEVDELFGSIRERLLAGMSATPDRVRELESAEWCAKSLERVADHATNIGERVVFLCTGEVIELNT